MEKMGYKWFLKEVDKITAAVMKEGDKIAIAAAVMKEGDKIAAAVMMSEEDEEIVGVLDDLEEELPHNIFY